MVRTDGAAQLGAWIRRHDLTITEAAVRFGVGVTTLRRWLAGLRVPLLLDAARVERETDGAIRVMSWVPKKLRWQSSHAKEKVADAVQ